MNMILMCLLDNNLNVLITHFEKSQDKNGEKEKIRKSLILGHIEVHLSPNINQITWIGY